MQKLMSVLSGLVLSDRPTAEFIDSLCRLIVLLIVLVALLKA